MSGQVNVVCGPPCGGKSTYVARYKAEGDCVIDLDALGVALGGEEHMNVSPLWRVAYAARKAAIAEAVRQPLNVWIIDTSPTEGRAARYRRIGAKFHVVDPGIGECLHRAKVDGRPRFTMAAIREWYKKGLSPEVTKRAGTVREMVLPQPF